MKRNRYKPYVRRANGREKTTSIVMAYRLAAFRLAKKPFFVMVQHGFPNLVMDCADTKRELMRSPVPVAFGKKTFRQWAAIIQRRARGY